MQTTSKHRLRPGAAGVVRRGGMLLVLLGGLPLPPLAGQETASIIGRITDAESLDPIAGVSVVVAGQDSVVTDAFGGFAVGALPPGEHRMELSSPGYTTRSEAFQVEAGQELVFSVLLYPGDPDEQTDDDVDDPAPAPTRAGGSSRQISRDRITEAVRLGLDLAELLARRMPSVRVRAESPAGGGGNCIEYRGSAPGQFCRHIGISLDGLLLPNPRSAAESIVLADVQTITLLSPSAASTRYGGDGGWGVLQIRTRSSAQPLGAGLEGRRYRAFDWSEETASYPWLRVLAVTFTVNAAALGLSRAAGECLQTTSEGQLSFRSSCGTMQTVGSVVLQGALPGVATATGSRWAGRTDMSRGSSVAASILGLSSTLGGYVALTAGEARGSDSLSITGGVILLVGTPLLVTLADRYFRVAR